MGRTQEALFIVLAGDSAVTAATIDLHTLPPFFYYVLLLASFPGPAQLSIACLHRELEPLANQCLLYQCCSLCLEAERRCTKC